MSFYIELDCILYLKYLFFSIELSSKKTNPVLKIGCILYLMAYWIFLYVVKTQVKLILILQKYWGLIRCKRIDYFYE